MTEACSLPLAIRCHFNFRNYSNEYEQNITQHHVWSVPTRSIRRSVLYGNLWRGNEQGDVIFKPPHDKYPNLFLVFGGIGTPMTPVKCTQVIKYWRGRRHVGEEEKIVGLHALPIQYIVYIVHCASCKEVTALNDSVCINNSAHVAGVVVVKRMPHDQTET